MGHEADPREDAPPVEEVPDLFAHGSELYNDGKYWAAHEAWEEAWHSLRADDREDDARFLRGVILATAALENLKRGKPPGFKRQMAKALLSLRELAGRGEDLLGWTNEETTREAWTDYFLEAMRTRHLSSIDDVDPDPPSIHWNG